MRGKGVVCTFGLYVGQDKTRGQGGMSHLKTYGLARAGPMRRTEWGIND
jgi:hypothetical protein